MTRKIEIYLLCAVLALACFSEAQAATKYKRARIAVSSSTALLLPAKTWVCGIKLHATSAAAQMGIYNCTTLGGATSPTDEIGEATQYNTSESVWLEPIYFENGVTVIVTNGVAFIEYLVSPY